MSVSQKQEAKEQWLSIGVTAPKLPCFVWWGFQSSWTMYHYGNQGQPEIYRCHRQTNYLAFLGRLIMWCSSNLYSSNLFSLEQGWCIFLRAHAKFLEKFLHVWKTWMYQHHISDYSSDALVPLIGWRPRQLPLRLTPMETTETNASNLDMLLFFIPQLQHDAESDHQQLIFQQDCTHLHYHLRCKHY